MKNKYNVERCIGLDFLKLCCCIFIIIIHLPINGVIRDNIVAVCRCAVPIFFMISGHFYKEEKLNKQIKKIIKYIIIANSIYLCINLIFNIGNLKEYLFGIFNIKEIIKCLVFNVSPVSNHLWYLNAILYVYIVLGLLKRIKINIKKIYILIPVLLCGDLIFGKYSLLLFNKEWSHIIVRNFLFVGLPYFLLGNYIKENNIGNNSKKYILLTVIFVITTILERSILCYFDINAVRDHYISTTFLALSLLLFFLNVKSENNLFRKLSEVGKKYSINIYIYHYIIIEIITKLIYMMHK